MSHYGWVIDTDHLAIDFDTVGTPEDASNVMGPRAIPDALRARLEAGEGARFRMYDDDDNLYYTGRLVLLDGDESVEMTRLDGYRVPVVAGGGVFAAEDEAGFGPLNDFGMPNAGCTSIFYEADGEWGVL